MRACCAATYPEPEVVEGRFSEVQPDGRTHVSAQQVATLLSTTAESRADHEKQKEVESRLEVDKMRLRQEVESRLEVEKMRLRQEADIEKQKEAESRLEVEKMRLRQQAGDRLEAEKMRLTQEAEVEKRRRRRSGWRSRR